MKKEKTILTHILNSTTIWRTKNWFALLAVILLISCKKSSHVGVDSDDVQMSYVDTFSVKVTTLLRDSVITSGGNSMLAGYINSTIFGSTKETSYFGLTLTEESVGLRDNAQLTKAVLHLTPSDEYSLGASKQLDCEIYELTESFTSGSYFNTDSMTYSGLVGTISSTGLLLSTSTNKSWI